MKRAFFVTAFLLLCAARVGAQVDSSCLVLWQDSPLFPGPGYGWQNFDSVKVNMCQGPQYLAEFAKNKFVVAFQYFIMPHYDSLKRTWREIDTSYSNIRAEFDSIEQGLGTFTLQLYDYVPDTTRNDPGDTSEPGDKLWSINFENFVNIDTALDLLRKLPELNTFAGADFEGRPLFYEGVKEDVAPVSIHIWPQPCSSQLRIQGLKRTDEVLSFDPLGRQISYPFTSTDGTLTLDISKQPDGVLYIYASGQFFKILIQH